MISKILEQNLHNLIKHKKNKTTKIYTIDISFLKDETIIKDYVMFKKYIKKYKKEFKIIFQDLERFNFQNKPSINNTNLASITDDEYNQKLSLISLYEHSVRVAKIAIKKYYGIFGFEDLLLLCLVHDFGKNEEIILNYKINTVKHKNHEEISAIYLEKIFKKNNKKLPENLYFLLYNHHYIRRIKNFSKADENIIKQLKQNYLYEYLVKADKTAREIEEMMVEMENI